MPQGDPNSSRINDEEAPLGHLGKLRFLALAMVGFGVFILVMWDPPRGMEGLLAWTLLAGGVCIVWLSYTRVGRDMAGAADGAVDRQNRPNS